MISAHGTDSSSSDSLSVTNAQAEGPAATLVAKEGEQKNATQKNPLIEGRLLSNSTSNTTEVAEQGKSMSGESQESRSPSVQEGNGAAVSPEVREMRRRHKEFLLRGFNAPSLASNFISRETSLLALGPVVPSCDSLSCLNALCLEPGDSSVAILQASGGPLAQPRPFHFSLFCPECDDTDDLLDTDEEEEGDDEILTDYVDEPISECSTSE
uniref:Uncharacterized protein n=1 Tax=Chromera velia CCMP2878 TaxID=1169474 RepID=A0A0G4H9D4_9ALVE|eukprot:Cvel_5920.t1-p1 / transcript=Cvel_5920.t1 / gene=Cvel_5920 / organism=Chromera_velia_CCMP2878 / gene_product=hypothetical protein / transcript_product=hypothetical protein / location=Cvel_scaffold283:48187-48819(-) / protein_length=211 / sequence_SO=supercontig / SO=protein_coding / is_pseudo=false